MDLCLSLLLVVAILAFMFNGAIWPDKSAYSSPLLFVSLVLGVLWTYIVFVSVVKERRTSTRLLLPLALRLPLLPPLAPLLRLLLLLRPRRSV